MHAGDVENNDINMPHAQTLLFCWICGKDNVRTVECCLVPHRNIQSAEIPCYATKIRPNMKSSREAIYRCCGHRYVKELHLRGLGYYNASRVSSTGS